MAVEARKQAATAGVQEKTLTYSRKLRYQAESEMWV